MESWTSRCVTWSIKRTKTIELHNQGIPAIRIADQLGVSCQAVRDWIRKEGMEPICVQPNKSKYVKSAKKGRFAHLR